MINRLGTFGMLIGVLLAAPLHAEDDGGAPRQYDIELLIFQNLVENDGGEVWPVDYSGWYEEETPGGDTAALPAPLTVTWLPESTYHLKAERATLNRSSRYRTLAYLAWRQPVTDRISARALELPARPRSDSAWVDGTVRVAVERYLHLYLDLKLHLPAPAMPAVTGATAMSESEDGYRMPEIRLTEQRRMRSKELHYFDNPRFGAIALITPYAPPVPAPDNGTTTDNPPPASGATP
jgi:hypothetical protein